jgi:hypothetical protein
MADPHKYTARQVAEMVYQMVYRQMPPIED